MSFTLSHLFPLPSNLPILVRSISKHSVTEHSKFSSPCLKLSCLPKAHRFKSLRYKRTLPGRCGHLAYDPSLSPKPALNPSNPLASLSTQQLLRSVPHYRCALFALHCYPFDVLKKFDYPEYMLSYKQKGYSNELHNIMSSSDPQINISPPARTFLNDILREKKSLPMPIMILLPRHVHKTGFVRSKIKSRLKEALKLVVVRGAIQSKTSNDVDFVSSEATTSSSIPLDEQLILKDWVYTFRPNAEMYLAPWPTLLNEIRHALEAVKRGSAMHKKNTRGAFNKSFRLSTNKDASSYTST